MRHKLFIALALLSVAPSYVLAQDTSESYPPNRQLVDAVEPFVKRNELAGAVMLVADKDKVLACDVVGHADIAEKRKMTPDALFWIASQSKTLTAAAFMTLVDEGKVSLDDPVKKYLPEFADVWVAVERDDKHMLLERPKREITVRHVLSHTSGLPFKSALETPTLDGLTLAVGTRGYGVTPLEYQPGEDYRYSNAGINTAGRIIEVVSEMSYEKFMSQRLFEPLGMNDTVIRPSKEQLRRLAKGYKPNAAKDGLEETTISQLTYPLNLESRQPMPAGGYFSTADDIGRFCRMLLNDGMWEGKRVLSKAAVAEISKRQTPPELKESYGLGAKVAPDGFGHGGAFATNMNVDKQRGLVTVWLVQHQGFPGDGKSAHVAFRKAAETIFGGK
ncbi:MAG: beta-lactamase family protein [Planctomycetales bacterium]|nr:beta-lactamase family protein [Planctomycetales bacterium]MBN8629062.1 beta-lactamase family protein [Planctomycetota bacterium]